jgi:hypothetical protein
VSRLPSSSATARSSPFNTFLLGLGARLGFCFRVGGEATFAVFLRVSAGRGGMASLNHAFSGMRQELLQSRADVELDGLGSREHVIPGASLNFNPCRGRCPRTPARTGARPWTRQ